MGIRRIYFVRHGETDHNVAHRWQGQLQTPLNETGKAQVAAISAYFKTIPLDVIITSDLVRARDTAQGIAAAQSMAVVEDPRWREFSLGVFEGKTRDELLALMPEAVAQWDSSSDFAPQGGQSRSTTQAHAYAAWLELSQRDDIQTALVVSHGGTLRMLMQKLFPDHAEKMHFGNTSITILERDMPGWIITALNTTPHFDEA